MFGIGSVVNCAMAKHIFGLKKITVTDETIVNQAVGFILNGLTEPSTARLRTNKKNGKGTHATN
jgi:hypothetical protein